MAKTAKFKIATKKRGCYAIELVCEKTGEFFYKIGETGVDKDDRIYSLIKTYEKESELSAVSLFTIPLPSKKGFYITDTTVRKYLIEHNDFKKVNPYEVKGRVNRIDGYTEWLTSPNRKKIDSNELKETIIFAIDELAKVDDNFTGMLKLSYDPTQTHKVSYRMMREFDKVMVDENGKRCSIEDLVNMTGKTILFIGQFLNDFIYSFALRNDVTIWHDNEEERVDSEYLPFNEKIHYVDDFKEIIAMEKKFDFIIANPPYSMGNDITNAVLHFVDFGAYVNLMPRKCYKGDLFKHILDVESAHDCFEDANIHDVLTVAILTKNESNVITNYDELELLMFDSNLFKFYATNNSRQFVGMTVTPQRPILEKYNKPWENIDPLTDFFSFLRTSQDGVYMKGKMYDWNNKIGNKDSFKDYIIRKYESQSGDYQVMGQFIFFEDPIKNTNFTNWFYSNNGLGLSHKLIKGLKRTTGTITPAIPRVDWSRPWTDEEILLDYGYTPEEIRKILA